jgi:hypothetical protein
MVPPRPAPGPALAAGAVVVGQSAGQSAGQSVGRVAEPPRQGSGLERQRAEELAAQEAARRPLATKLAALLGNPGWMVDGWTIKPGPTADAYRVALAKCRRLGLPVTEHEKVAETSYHQTVESAHHWADVEFEGERFEIDGGAQMYFGNEW